MKTLLIGFFLTIFSSSSHAFPGMCACGVTIGNQASPGEGTSIGMKLSASACKQSCANFSVGNLGCGQSATRWFKFKGDQWSNANSSVTSANCVCPVTSSGNISYGQATELLPADCSIIAYQNGNQGGGSASPNGDPTCSLSVGPENCFQTLKCQVQGHDYCIKKVFTGSNFTSISSSKNFPLVCATGLIYRIDLSGKIDACSKKIIKSDGVGAAKELSPNLIKSNLR